VRREKRTGSEEENKRIEDLEEERRRERREAKRREELKRSNQREGRRKEETDCPKNTVEWSYKRSSSWAGDEALEHLLHLLVSVHYKERVGFSSQSSFLSQSEPERSAMPSIFSANRRPYRCSS
jgi:hypothetical protein